MDDIQYTQYYVAFLDILGFKNLVANPEVTCREILKVYASVKDVHEVFLQEEDMKENIKMKIMSDSVCTYIKASIPNALFALVSHCALFHCSLLDMYPSIFIRGGITFGDMYVENDIIFGPALTEAYLLEERNAKVPRVIMRKCTLDHGLDRSNNDTQKLLQYWTFRDEDAFYVVDYFKLACREENSQAIEHAKATASNWLDTTIDESIRQKYLYVEKQIRKH